MIDGVKIQCFGIAPETWLESPLLDFQTKVSYSTGEVMDGKLMAIYRGLMFSVIPSIIPALNGFALSVRGSLATYYNNGENNAFDFTTDNLKQVFEELKNDFGINPSNTKLTSFEFGANITPEQSNDRIIKGLRAFEKYQFTRLKDKNLFNGRQIKKQNHSFKVYDKGLQTDNTKSNLLRIEYKLNYSKTCNKYGFYTLNDLINTDKLKAIKSVLLQVWNNSIFYDYGMSYRRMTSKQQKKMLYYLDACNWDKFSPAQRQKAKLHFNKLYEEFCTSTTKENVSLLTAQKMDVLTAVTPNQKRYVLQDFERNEWKPEKTPKKICFTSLDKPVNHIQNTPEKTQNINPKKMTEKSPKKPKKIKLKKCRVCSSDISSKKAIALYCSKRCNNSHHATQRKIKRHQTKKDQTKELKTLTKNIKTKNLPLLIDYRINGVTYSDQLEQKEVFADVGMIQKIIKVQILDGSKMVFSSWRAKSLIRIISIYNNMNRPTGINTNLINDKPP